MNKVKWIISISIVASLMTLSYQTGYSKSKDDTNTELAKIWANCIFAGNSAQECGIGFVKRWLYPEKYLKESKESS